MRLVFCYYAEDAGLFGNKEMLHDYLSEFNVRHFRNAIIDLFNVLNTKVEDRDSYLDEMLAKFLYVNGDLFKDMNIEIPQFTEHLRELILDNASSSFDWSEIRPTIFGGVFESTLNPDQRREDGMHYTSIENIHKVIDPLFLGDLKNELDEIKQLKQPATIRKRAQNFQKKLGNLTFLDPAAGSGNFLTETYLELSRLENEALELYMDDNLILDVGEDLIQVTLYQFHGIEINDFAVSVAKTALWIAESQMFEETQNIIYSNMEFLPLESYINIVEGNALEMIWHEIVDKRDLDYIIGKAPKMVFGSMANDGGNLILSSEERDVLIKNYPQAKQVIRRFTGVREYINNIERYCLWIEPEDLNIVRKIPPIMDSLEEVKEHRLNSKRKNTQDLADMPYAFGEIRQTKSDYLIIPRVSSENRRYVPIGYLNRNIVTSDAALIIPDAKLYHFAILSSNVHMSWMRTVAGRLKSDYRYSASIVYNNFLWIPLTESQKKQLNETANEILKARIKYSKTSLADLYNELIMPPELRKAHQNNDRLVMELYGMDVRKTKESNAVEKLFEMYNEMTKKE